MLIPTIISILVVCGSFDYIATVTERPKNWTNTNSQGENQYIYAIFDRCPGWCNKKYCKIQSSCRPHNRTSKLQILDIYFNDGVVLEAPVFLNVSAYKKFGTQYRPFMLSIKDEICKFVLSRSHPAYKAINLDNIKGNLFDPCPISGHRYEEPKYTSTWMSTLVPTGEWRLDHILSKVIDGVEEKILSVSIYALVKARTATEF